MAIGLVGRKCGMTRIFTDAGVSVPVTVIEVDPNRITQIKTLETDGYQAIQITTGERRESRVTNALKGHFAKAGVAAGRLVQEFRATEADLEGREVGGTLTVDLFTVGQIVDVTGQSKGKGFQGETIDEAVVREVKEETGLDCLVKGLIGFRTGVIRNDISDNMAIFYCQLIDETQKIMMEEKELLDVRWLNTMQIATDKSSSVLLREMASCQFENHQLCEVEGVKPGEIFGYTAFKLFIKK